jgi:hypothetical protein
MLDGDQGLSDHPVAKSNSEEETESVILPASLGIFDVTLSSWAASRPRPLPSRKRFDNHSYKLTKYF